LAIAFTLQIRAQGGQAIFDHNPVRFKNGGIMSAFLQGLLDEVVTQGLEVAISPIRLRAPWTEKSHGFSFILAGNVLLVSGSGF
jgi:hypothetical protein